MENRDYDPNNRPTNPLEAVKRAFRKAGVQVGDVTGRLGYDPQTGLPVVESSNQPIQAAKDRVEKSKQG